MNNMEPMSSRIRKIENMDIEEIQANRAVDLLAKNKQQANRIKALEAEIGRLKHSTIVNEKICESWAECREFDCPHLRPHKEITEGRSKCILHANATCRKKPIKSGYKICVDNK